MMNKLEGKPRRNSIHTTAAMAGPLTSSASNHMVELRLALLDIDGSKEASNPDDSFIFKSGSLFMAAALYLQSVTIETITSDLSLFKTGPRSSSNKHIPISQQDMSH